MHGWAPFAGPRVPLSSATADASSPSSTAHGHRVTIRPGLYVRIAPGPGRRGFGFQQSCQRTAHDVDLLGSEPRREHLIDAGQVSGGGVTALGQTRDVQSSQRRSAWGTKSSRSAPRRRKYASPLGRRRACHSRRGRAEAGSSRVRIHASPIAVRAGVSDLRRASRKSRCPAQGGSPPTRRTTRGCPEGTRAGTGVPVRGERHAGRPRAAGPSRSRAVGRRPNASRPVPVGAA